MSSRLPSDFQNEIQSLSRLILQDSPADTLQYCADHFQRRLASQRAEALLQQKHPTTGAGMAASHFQGGNPFGASSSSSASTAAAAAGGAGLAGVTEEEEEHDLASPTASSFAPNVRDGARDRDAPSPTTGTAMTNSGSGSDGAFGGGSGAAAAGVFGNYGGFGASAAPPPSSSNETPPTTTSTAPSSDKQQQRQQQQYHPTNYNMSRRTSVSAESLAPASSTSDHTPYQAPSFPKTPSQLSRLRSAVAHNFLFSHLDDEQASLVLGALQERKVPAKDIRVIVQGDTGDFFYVVESGGFDIYVSSTGKLEPGPQGMGMRVASSGPGSSFGELALMYNAPRAATVISAEPSVLWQLDRITFRRILMDSAFQRRRMYESFLETVPLFSALTPYERSKIADALETTKYPAHSTIIREGDAGDKFYILEAGEAEVVKRGVQGRVRGYGKGDYFGELALLDEKPRAASVVSVTEVKVATLSKDGFQRLLGPVEAVMRRDDPRRK